DTLIEGEVEAGKRYEEGDFNTVIEIREREKKRVEIFMSEIDQREKTPGEPSCRCAAIRPRARALPNPQRVVDDNYLGRSTTTILAGDLTPGWICGVATVALL
ncbi:MAG: hypothetical protein ACXW2G_13335, partial [Burkholderiaceae bacterium]